MNFKLIYELNDFGFLYILKDFDNLYNFYVPYFTTMIMEEGKVLSQILQDVICYFTRILILHVYSIIYSVSISFYGL